MSLGVSRAARGGDAQVPVPVVVTSHRTSQGGFTSCLPPAGGSARGICHAAAVQVQVSAAAASLSAPCVRHGALQLTSDRPPENVSPHLSSDRSPDSQADVPMRRSGGVVSMMKKQTRKSGIGQRAAHRRYPSLCAGRKWGRAHRLSLLPLTSFLLPPSGVVGCSF
jgi:hypothetical protein